jgi:hypothetical protein
MGPSKWVCRAKVERVALVDSDVEQVEVIFLAKLNTRALTAFAKMPRESLDEFPT